MEVKLCAVGFLLLSVAVIGSHGLSACDTTKELTRSTGPFMDNELSADWYRVNDHELEDDPLKPNDCGIKYPVWAKGPEADNDQEVDLTGCVVNETHQCATELSIKAKDCGEYTVYYLVPTMTKDQAYCFKKDGDDDDDDDCEEVRHHGKKFHRCRRNHRGYIVVIGLVAIVAAMIAIAAFILYRRRKAAALARKEQYKQKPSEHVDGPVVVATNDSLPPKY